MTQEDKELLLKDLCTRLPYGIKCKDQYGEYIDVNIYNAHLEHLVDQIVSGVVQMVLRPLSSMTDEEREEYRKFSYYGAAGMRDSDFTEMVATPSFEKMDFLNLHHFDYRGLIEKGLALKAPEGMYK